MRRERAEDKWWSPFVFRVPWIIPDGMRRATRRPWNAKENERRRKQVEKGMLEVNR